MKASDYLIMFVLCTTMMTGVTACSKDGDGKLNLLRREGSCRRPNLGP